MLRAIILILTNSDKSGSKDQCFDSSYFDEFFIATKLFRRIQSLISKVHLYTAEVHFCIAEVHFSTAEAHLISSLANL